MKQGVNARAFNRQLKQRRAQWREEFMINSKDDVRKYMKIYTI